MNMQAEFEFLVQFIRQNGFNVERCRDQFRALWTAYCLHYNMTVDTGPYDLAMRELWSAAAEIEEDTADWSDFDTFDIFMCGLMI